MKRGGHDVRPARATRLREDNAEASDQVILSVERYEVVLDELER